MIAIYIAVAKRNPWT